MPGATTARLVVCDFRDADEAVHDAPDRAEQADEGRGRADGGEHAGAAQHPPRAGRLDALEARRDPLLDALAIVRAGGELELGRRRRRGTRGPRRWLPASRSTPSAGERALASVAAAARTRRLAAMISMVLASHTVQVTNEASASPISTAFTTGSALRYMPHGERSRGSVSGGSVPVPITTSCAGAANGRTASATAATARAIATGEAAPAPVRRGASTGRQWVFADGIWRGLTLR